MDCHTKDAILAYYRPELPAERISLDPVRHVASIAATRSDCIVSVHKRHIVFDVFKTIFEVFVRSTAPFAVYS
jgi:hypothetical protein